MTREIELTKETNDLWKIIQEGPVTKEQLHDETGQDYPGMSKRLGYLKKVGLIELKNSNWQKTNDTQTR